MLLNINRASDKSRNKKKTTLLLQLIQLFYPRSLRVTILLIIVPTLIDLLSIVLKNIIKYYF